MTGRLIVAVVAACIWFAVVADITGRAVATCSTHKLAADCVALLK